VDACGEDRAGSEDGDSEALLQVLTIYRFKRVGAGSRTPVAVALQGFLAEAGLPVICVETRHMRAMLKAQINKTDRNDAWNSADDAGGTLSPGACGDITQPSFGKAWVVSHGKVAVEICSA
jgi:hypothetical protein